MGEVVKFLVPSDPDLFDALRAALSADGAANATIGDLSVSVDAWRKTARAAARSLGRPVETVEGPGTVHAVLRDWPANPEEEAKLHARMREAMNAMSTKLIPPTNR